LSSMAIPASVQIMGDHCFEDCEKLCSVTFDPNCHIEEFSEELFRGCLSLLSMTIPASVEHIEDSCFLGCRKLTTIDIAVDAVNNSRDRVQHLSTCLIDISRP
jgi:hypothetical protein